MIGVLDLLVARSDLAVMVELPKRAGTAAYNPNHTFVNPYIYDPSEPLAILGFLTITLLSTLSIYQFLRHRSFFFWTAIIGVLMLTLGHICRLISALDERKDTPFLVAWLMILLAPSFLAAACYTAFSRVVWFSCPPYALTFAELWCFPRWITPTFVIFDLFSFAIQLVGASHISRQFATTDADHPDRSIGFSERRATPGRVILLLGLVLQMLCFVTFSVISVRYFYISRFWRHADLGDLHLWRKLSYTINLSSIIIALRAIYRTMEIPHDKDYGLLYLQSHEWCFWAFDTVPIVAVLVVFAVWHPGRYLPRSYTGWTLDKGRAVKEKSEMGSMCGGVAGAGMAGGMSGDHGTAGEMSGEHGTAGEMSGENRTIIGIGSAGRGTSGHDAQETRAELTPPIDPSAPLAVQNAQRIQARASSASSAFNPV